MRGFLSWVNANWFSFAQTAGIIASLNIAAATLRQQSLLTLTEQHGKLWEEASVRPELARVLRWDVDFTTPPSDAETNYLNRVIVHYLTGWGLAKDGTAFTPAALAKDARGFFSRPLPRAVWDATKECRDERFVKFIDRALEAGRLRPGA